MRRLAYIFIPWLVLLPALWAQDQQKAKDAKADQKPPTAEEQFKKLIGEVQKAMEPAREAMQKANSQEDRDKVIAEFKGKLSAFGPRFLELAEKNPKDQVALNAIGFIVTYSQDEKTTEKAEKFLRGLIEKSTDTKFQAEGTLLLANTFKTRSEAPGLKLEDIQKFSKEAEDLYNKIVTKYADQKQIAARAKEDLEAIQKFGIGKKPPEIAGEDGDGKKFKLSDYKGKVVVLDFWASW